MNDRELLELAAKAAGITLAEWSEIEQGFRRVDGGYFRPHIDDGDALRLAVALRLLIDTEHCAAMPMNRTGENIDDWSDGGLDDDPHAATRRAIVRAAAEIGKEMK
jgi:hypothetical protein